LKQMGFMSMVNESCLYYRVFRGSLNVIALYVDDLIIWSLFCRKAGKMWKNGKKTVS